MRCLITFLYLIVTTIALVPENDVYRGASGVLHRPSLTVGENPLAAVEEPVHAQQCAKAVSRREALAQGSLTSLSVFGLPLTSKAAETGGSASPDLVTLSNLLEALRAVPTFAIVNPPEGIPFMLYRKETRSAVGYAFVTFPGALAVLGDAKRTADKGGYGDVWKDAKITIIPADIALRLTLQPRERTSQKEDAKANSILTIVPGADEREAAIQIDSKFKDQSKCPVFFFEAFRLENGATPLYFNPRDLLDAWNSKTGVDGGIPPRIQVIDLGALLQYILRSRADELPLRGKIVFVPTSESVQMAKEVKAEGLTPYNTNRMII